MLREDDGRWKYNYGDLGHDESDELFYYLLDEIVDIFVKRGMATASAIEATLDVHNLLIDKAQYFKHVLHHYEGTPFEGEDVD